ncbi:MAG: OmpA family protein [Salinibacter sp.]|uniref:OmpA family protein n=1 Tax=Salinibacter sp. TaxID=2065818 RepID=UPI0035D3DE4E
MITACRTSSALLFATVLLLAGCATVEESVEEEVDERIQENVDEGVEKTADKIEGGIENAVKCVVGDEECIRKAKKNGETVVLTDEEGNIKRDENGDPVTASDRSSQQTTGEQNTGQQETGQAVGDASTNYDFEPGERTIFAEDFSDDNVGDFPRSLQFRKGSMEIVEWKGRRFLRVNSAESRFRVNLPETLPKRFTMSFDFYTTKWTDNMHITPLDSSGNVIRKNYFHIGGGELGVGTLTRGGVESLEQSRKGSNQIVTVRIMVDGSYAKVYMDKKRFANIPNAKIERTNTLRFSIPRLHKHMYIGDLRIAGGGRDLYSALQNSGRVAVQDIHFDTGKATLKSSSTKTLKKIASLMKEHPDLDLLIEGHTDNTGGFEANKKLSRKRAQAVKSALVENHGIDASRLKTVGLGSTQPTAPNDTEKGRAKNRRVELVKQ